MVKLLTFALFQTSPETQVPSMQFTIHDFCEKSLRPTFFVSTPESTEIGRGIEQVVPILARFFYPNLRQL